MMRQLSFGAALVLAVASSVVTAQAVAPTPTHTFLERMRQDYPFDAVQNGRSAGALVEIWTDERGSIYKCDLETFVGDEHLAKQICGIFLKKRMNPARVASGAPAIGRLRTLFKLSAPGNAQATEVEETVERPDVELTVNRLPGGVQSYDIKIVLVVDSSGKIASCRAEQSADPQFASVACTQLAALSLPAGTGPKGEPVPYVTEAKVRFSKSAQ